MTSGTRAQLFALAIEADLPHLLLQWIALIRSVVNKLARMIDARDAADFEISLRELAFKLESGAHRILLIVAVEIDMRVPVAPRGEHNGSLSDGDVVDVVEELVIDEIQHLLGLALADLRKVEIAMLVVACQGFDPHRLVIDPAEARNVILPRADRKPDPGNSSSGGADDANPNVGIG